MPDPPPSPSRAPTYSFVIPVFNEADGLEELHRRLTALAVKLDGPSEFILIDDGSGDESYGKMQALRADDPRYRLIQLSRNFGHQIAVTAGIDAAAGEAVVILDADLQDPPEAVLEMAKRWREGYEVVYAVRRHRKGESAFKRFTAQCFYRLLRRLTNTDIPADTGDFRLVDRRAVDAVKAMPENNRFLRGMFAWVGFRQVGVTYDRDERFSGSSKYPLRKMVRLSLDAMLGFSSTPLKFVILLGLVVATLSFGYGMLAIIFKIGHFQTEPGWTSLVVIVTFLGGVQLLATGIIGQYLSRVFDEVRRRPLYLVRRQEGVSPGNREDKADD